MAKDKAQDRPNPPSKVPLVYKVVGGNTHVFTTNDFRGFYVGHASLRAAFDGLARALSEHVSLVYDTKAEYVLDMSFESFAARLAEPSDHPLASNFMFAKRAAARSQSISA